jgi:membrane-associated phospholipid phosphatase
MNLRRDFSRLNSTDIVILGFFTLLSIINMVFASSIPNWWVMVIVNFCVISAILTLGWARARTGSRVIALIHDWHVAPTVFFSFKELYFMIKPLHHGLDYDDWLIAADRWLFGVDPGRWLMQFSTPWLTEVLQIAYTSFYFLFILIGLDLYKERPKTFHFFMFASVYGFYLSYLGYFALPAVGPRFTLFDFPQLDHDLPGVLLTPALRWFVNWGGSVPMGVPNEVAMAGTQRDVFPSGHTMMTLVLMYLTMRYRLKIRWVMLVTGLLLILATVYMRYHYVIDLIAGGTFAVICLATAPRLYGWITGHFDTLDRGGVV